MNIITVNASKTYDVKIGENLLDAAGTELRALTKAKKAAVVTDSNVAPLYLQRLEASLREAGFETCAFVFPAGEASKNAETYLKLLRFLAEHHLTRSDLVVALGGGVTGDMAGFAAATYLRGIGFAQIPTSLLAMVDSSVGGKTAIDLPEGKNLVGAFYQPMLVLCDISLLESLPQENFLDGCGEIVKYGVLGDENLLSTLQKDGLSFDREGVISRCVEMKRDIVNADEFESGQRQLLNLGHTLGHAVEAKSNFTLSHGCAVSVGLAVVTRAAVKAGICPQKDGTQILSALTALGLPTKTEQDIDALFSVMLSDKKRSGDSITCVIPEKIGSCIRKKMSISQLKEFMEAGM